MVLRYMVSDTDLAKGEFAQPKEEMVPRRAGVKEIVQPKKSTSAPKKRVTLWVVMAANVILCMVVYYLWTTDKNPFTLGFLKKHNKVMVTGIIYNVENPSAIVSGKIVHESDTIGGYKVIKIYRDKVEFERKGESFTKQVRQ